MIELTIFLTISLMANVMLLYYYLLKKDHLRITNESYQRLQKIIKIQGEQLKHYRGVK
jgi:hypothetical protein